MPGTAAAGTGLQLTRSPHSPAAMTDFISRISVVCFAASYLVALAFEMREMKSVMAEGE